MVKWIIKWWIKRHYGVECDEWDKDCGICFAWLCYYYLFDDERIYSEGGQWKLFPEGDSYDKWLSRKGTSSEERKVSEVDEG